MIYFFIIKDKINFKKGSKIRVFVRKFDLKENVYKEDVIDEFILNQFKNLTDDIFLVRTTNQYPIEKLKKIVEDGEVYIEILENGEN